MSSIADHESEAGTLVPARESVLCTYNGSLLLITATPEPGKESEPMGAFHTLLAGILFRIEEEPEFLTEMSKWIEDNWPEDDRH